MREIGRKYGAGLFLAAAEAGADTEILFEMRVLSGELNKAYLRLLVNPEIPKSERIGLVGELLDGKVQPYLANFVKLMAARSLALELADAFEEYERLCFEHHAIVKVTVESAVPLTDLQKAKLVDKLTSRTGQTVEIEYEVTPSLIGGMKLTYAGKTVDGTVKKSLGEIGTALARNVI